MLLLALQQNTNTSSMSTNDIILYIAIVLSVILIFISSKKGKKVYTKKQGQLAIDMENYIVTMDVECTKGTYIRTLCEDIGILCVGQ